MLGSGLEGKYGRKNGATYLCSEGNDRGSTFADGKALFSVHYALL